MRRADRWIISRMSLMGRNRMTVSLDLVGSVGQ